MARNRSKEKNYEKKRSHLTQLEQHIDDTNFHTTEIATNTRKARIHKTRNVRSRKGKPKPIEQLKNARVRKGKKEICKIYGHVMKTKGICQKDYLLRPLGVTRLNRACLILSG